MALDILYVGMKYDYGDPSRGFSFEHWNFYHTMESLGHHIHYFDFDSLEREYGHKQMNDRLFDIVEHEKPDVLFCFLHEDELDQKIIKRISSETDTITINWFADDHWRFEQYSKHWAPAFNWVITTDAHAPEKYEAIGCRNVIRSQWGYNHFLYRNLGLPAKYDVTFIGQPHGDRRAVIDALVSASIDVKVWGHGWGTGRLSQQEMIKVFNQSKINLNLSNASRTPLSSRFPPGVRKLKRSLRGKMKKNKLGAGAWDYARDHLARVRRSDVLPDQVKARNFEIPGCGGFQISSPAEGLEEYFRLEKEIVTAGSSSDLISTIQYYLKHDDERIAIAEAGHKRAEDFHTYAHRFDEIFRIIGF